MDENYTGRGDDVTGQSATNPEGAAPSPDRAFARALLLQLLPGYDADQLIRALIAERQSGPTSTDDTSSSSRYNGDEQVALRELERARAQIALGESARTLQHAFNNPLTALLAEAQLLELDPMGDEQRSAVRRILELARRLVGLSRRLGSTDGPKAGV